jgi:hypothetical protein
MRATSERDIVSRAPKLEEDQHLPSALCWRKMFVAQLAELAAETTDTTTLTELSASNSVAVRLSVAANPATPLEVVATLQNDKSEFVSWEAFRNIRSRAMPNRQFQLLRMCSELPIE